MPRKWRGAQQRKLVDLPAARRNLNRPLLPWTLPGSRPEPITARRMRHDLLNILACPVCRGALTLEAETIAPGDAPGAGEVLTGTLTCPACPEVYPIDDGIPNLLPPDLRNAEAAGR